MRNKQLTIRGRAFFGVLLAVPCVLIKLGVHIMLGSSFFITLGGIEAAISLISMLVTLAMVFDSTDDWRDETSESMGWKDYLFFFTFPIAVMLAMLMYSGWTKFTHNLSNIQLWEDKTNS